MKSETIKLGVVGVDSGQLVICDPCYIEDEFQHTPMSKTLDQVPNGEFSRLGIFKTTNSQLQGGQLNYRLGHEGVAVAFQSGFGDGTYEVFAEIIDAGSWGKRVKKVWVELITDEEMFEIEGEKTSK